MTYAKCIVCGGNYRESRIPGLLTCLICGFVTANVSLSSEQLRRLYCASYFNGEEYKNYVSERALIEKQFRIRLKRLLRYVEDPAAKQLLEIGCAYGFFMSVALDSFRAVEGLDISEDAIRYAREELGLAVHAADFLKFEPTGPVDVVCLWDTIEHLERPDLYLEKAACMMQCGGVIALTTGDIGSLVARLRGVRWRQIHPPTHLQYFSRTTLLRLLGKYGFRVRYCGYDGMYRSVDTMAYIILNLKNRQPGLYSLLKRSGFLKWDLYLNLYDILFVVAERA
jgi:2-polyprenyl-3-methyl-5-hydroxy-6-metoxy-1,4-benzoquinol methylase